MRVILMIGAAVGLGLAGWAQAQSNPVVVELYTSQGCSSCPPADAFMHKLETRDDVIALALHVDYWDYIGWKDVFGDPAYSERQRRYAKTGGRRSVYTPQMIIAGQEDVVGTHPMDVSELIKLHAAKPARVKLSINRSGGTVAISAEALSALSTPLEVQIVRYKPKETVDILRGENAGKTLSYSNIVTDWQVVGTWDTHQPLRTEAAVRGDQPVVVILQQPGGGAIEAAARAR